MTIQNLTVRGKLTLSFGVLAFLILVVAAVAMKSLNDANDRFSGFVQGINARLMLSDEVRTAVDRRAIAARDLINAPSEQSRSAIMSEVQLAHEDIKKSLDHLLKLTASDEVPPEERALVAAISDIEKQYAPVALRIVALAAEGQRDEAVGQMNAECRPLLAQLSKAAENYRSYTTTHSSSLIDHAAQDFALQRNLLILCCLGAFAAAAIAGTLIVRSLSKALGAEPSILGAVAERVAAGDLGPVKEAADAAPGSVLSSLSHMQQSLARIVSQVRSSSDSIATGSAQIATGNSDLSQRTEEQASNLQQTAASMEQLSGTVKTSADTAREANRLAAEAAAAAQHGGEMVAQVVNTMREISTSSKKISDIIGVIDGIAFQTNILALNAAVEAARAGEQGRGFAVVAGEVRTLAQRSADAAKEIKSLIGASVDAVDSGAKRVDDAGMSMTAIVTQVQKVSQMISELSNASAEQSTGIGQVGDAVQQLDQVTQQNAALVEQTAAAAESLRHQAAHLLETVGVFKLEASEKVDSHPAMPAARSVPQSSGAQRTTTPATPAVATRAEEWASF